MGDTRPLMIALARMNHIREVDTANNTLTVEAGVMLATAQAAAADNDRLFPLSLAAEGSCQIGGNLSSNAGGLAVLRYGTMRDLTLGIEAVLPDGSILQQLHGLRKNNTGYDLKHLLIGAEGTLGIITAATLKLYPRPRAYATAWVTVTDPAHAVTLLRALEARFSSHLVAYELVSRLCLDVVRQHCPTCQLPTYGDWNVLLELSAEIDDGTIDTALIDWLSHCGLIEDALLAQNSRQRAELWAIREAIPEAERRRGPCIKHDIALPISNIAPFMQKAESRLKQAFPQCQLIIFGHLGDGNLHYNVEQALADEEAVNTLVYDTVAEFGGSISAEHGIGQLRRHWLARYQDPVALATMRAIKQTLDPESLMNPGKIFE